MYIKLPIYMFDMGLDFDAGKSITQVERNRS
jgi:hypothetical protein